MSKECSACHETKDYSSFYRDKSASDGFRSRCKECDARVNRSTYRANPNKYKERSRQWATANPDKIKQRAKRYRETGRTKKNRIKSRYGITEEIYQAMGEAQGWKCAICGEMEKRKGKSLAIDHDHATGRIRGLLCGYCNLLLGHAKDSTEVLTKAIQYLVEEKQHG